MFCQENVGVEMYDPSQVQIQEIYQCYSKPPAGQEAWVHGREEDVKWSDGKSNFLQVKDFIL